MKKKKINLLLNIAVLCLCVCAIAIGVYSAKNASLNVSGTVGFNAHNCNVDVTAYIYGDSVDENGNASSLGTPRQINNRREAGSAEIKGDFTKSISLDKFYFCDMTDDGSIEPIHIAFKLTNQSSFNVDVRVSANITPNNANIIITKPQEITLNDKNAGNQQNEDELDLVLKLNQTTDITENVTISITLDMCKERESTAINNNWYNTEFYGEDEYENSIFNPNGYILGDNDSETILTVDNIQSINFSFNKPDSSYKQALDLNLADSLTDTINMYVKEDDSTSNYDIMIYSDAKIFTNECVGMFKDWSNLTAIDFSNFYIGDVLGLDMVYMFYNCSSLTSLDLSNFDTINVLDMQYMFYGCSSLITLDLYNFITDNVTNMTNMFYECGSLTSLEISNFDTANVEDMSFMFCGCGSLTTLDVSNFNTNNVTNMEYLFSGCGSLIALDTSNFSTVNVTSMFRMFDSCEKLKDLNVSNFDTSNVTNMSYMFSLCKELKFLDMLNFNTSVVTDMKGMFDGCAGLKVIYVGSLWSVDNVEYSDDMFYRCTSLKGGAGTTYDSTKTDKTYARVDGGTSAPGYLTLKTA